MVPLPRARSLDWRLPIVLPALLAAVLVAVLAAEAARSVQANRRTAANAVRDYAHFAAWQYARRASDYLRLTIITALHANEVGAQPPIHCRLAGDSVIVDRNHTGVSDRAIVRAITPLLPRGKTVAFGLTSIDGTDKFLGYGFTHAADSSWTGCDASVFAAEELVPVFNHVAHFAPLLPPSLVSGSADSLVGLELRAASGVPIASIGRRAPGVIARDTLSPNLAGVEVIATLHDAAITRLVGAMQPTSSGLLGAMVAVALILCAVAVVQLRRTSEIIRLRGDFVAGVSHELKTPLTQISLFVDTLARRPHDAEAQRRYLSIISREARRLSQLVDRILHFAGMMRSTAAGGEPREPSFLGEELRGAIEAIAPIAEARGMTITLDSADEIELPLDRDGFRQVVLNLLDNAIKFGPDGQTIRVTAECSEQRAVILVDDEGPGIDSHDALRVFEPFVRAVGRRSGAAPAGSGIGLAVVRDVVLAHRGVVRLERGPMGGARAVVELPEARVSENIAPLVER